MTSIGSPSPFFLAGKKAYEVERSLRFNSGDSPYLAMTLASAGNRKKWTWSAWIKISNLGRKMLFSTPDGVYPTTTIEITSSNTLAFYNYDSGYQWELRPSRVYRDSSAWFHLVVVVDTPNSTSGDRVQVYFNGVRETSFSTETYPSQNLDGGINATVEHRIGHQTNRSGSHFDGYMAEINFIDGQAYGASYFGQTDAITGQWNPKKYTGSYGTYGFYLNFSNNSGTSSTTLGKDSSGNDVDFTPNNFSVAAGAGNDSLEDTPTNNFCTMNPLFMNATEVAGTMTDGNLTWRADNNYCTGQANFSVKTGKWYWEAELNSEYVNIGGITRGTNPAENTYIGYDTNGNLFGFGYYFSAGNVKGNGSDGTTSNQNLATGQTTFANGDICGFASDIPNGTLAFYKNGTLVYTITGISSSFDWMPSFSAYGTSAGFYINFGQRAFAHTPPTGHQALCSANLPDPTILLPNKHFDIDLYTGTGSTLERSAFNFQPDWLWFKSRSASGHNHALYDSVRGRAVGLSSDQTYSEFTSSASNDLVSFDNDGFTIGGNQNFASVNGSGTKVAWAWNAGDTDGKTYTVKVHDFSGNNRYIFDDFQTEAVTIRLAKGGTYIFDQSDSSNAGHPLRFSATSNGTHGGGTEYTTGVTTAGTPGSSGAYTQIVVDSSAPVLYYYCTQHSGMGGQIDTNSDLGSSNFDGTLQSTVKVNPTAGFSIVSYTVGNFSGMTMGHGLGVAPVIAISKKRSGTSDWSVQFVNPSDNSTDYMFLNKQDAKGDTSTYFTSTTVKDGFGTGSNGSTIIQYVFSEVAGYSKLGSYVGNGNANGTFVFTGFRPAWLIIKQTGQMDWVIDDTTRSPFNESNATLFANLSDAEYTGGAYGIDILSNGFKPYNTYNQYNQSGGTYIYLAFAESPFKYARAR